VDIKGTGCEDLKCSRYVLVVCSYESGNEINGSKIGGEIRK
jgi:hypothetical protein